MWAVLLLAVLGDALLFVLLARASRPADAASEAGAQRLLEGQARLESTR